MTEGNVRNANNLRTKKPNTIKKTGAIQWAKRKSAN